MNAARYGHDRLAALYQLRGFAVANARRAELTRVRKLRLNLFVFFESREVCGRTDRRHNERLAQRSLPESFKVHAVARAVQASEVIDDLTPRREFSIVARRKPEHRRRHRNIDRARWLERLCRTRERTHEQKQQQRKFQSHPAQFSTKNAAIRPIKALAERDWPV